MCHLIKFDFLILNTSVEHQSLNIYVNIDELCT